ncbi:MAG: GNAT family N-acetyltransferase [Rhodobacterales bacterium]
MQIDRPSQATLFATIDATWAPFAFHQHKGWLIREGAGGGQRVSAATVLPGAQNNPDIGSAADKMRSMGQKALFMVRSSDGDLDAKLSELGYKIVDPVTILITPTDNLLNTAPKQHHSVTALKAPDTTAKSVWGNGGIDRPRLNVMARVKTAKTTISAGNMGVAFAACHKGIAMVHAVEVSKNHRRKGVANALMLGAAHWAKQQECAWLAVLTVRANTPACALYDRLKMKEAAAYHYRLLALD